MIYANACLYSSSGIIGPLWPDRCPGYGHVNSRRATDLWNHHKLHDVFPGGAGFLEPFSTCINKEWALLCLSTLGVGALAVGCELLVASCGLWYNVTHGQDLY